MGSNNRSVCISHANQLFMSVSDLYSCLLILSVSSYLLHSAINGLSRNGQAVTFSALWKLGFGTVNSSAIFGSTGGIIPTVLLANVPQFPVSIAYFLYNNLLTNMLLAAEYDDYATQRKPLRVSWPKGSQRSTYYLSLPYKYSIPLLISHAVLHWLVSQSFFFLEIFEYDIYGKVIPDNRLVSCGYSPIAIIFAISLGSLMVCTIISLGMRRFSSNMPLAASCSAAISAACHPPPGDQHALKPVMWGEIPVKKVNHSRRTGSETDYEEAMNHSESSFDTRAREPDGEDSSPYQRQGEASDTHLLTESNGPSEESFAGCGHCSFSSLEVITPDPLRLYA